MPPKATRFPSAARPNPEMPDNANGDANAARVAFFRKFLRLTGFLPYKDDGPESSSPRQCRPDRAIFSSPIARGQPRVINLDGAMTLPLHDPMQSWCNSGVAPTLPFMSAAVKKPGQARVRARGL